MLLELLYTAYVFHKEYLKPFKSYNDKELTIILLSNNLLSIPALLKVALKAKRIIYQNFAWAIVYNVIAIPLAGLGLVTPLVAAIGMSVSSAIVIANSLRIGFLSGKDSFPNSSPGDTESTSKQLSLVN